MIQLPNIRPGEAIPPDLFVKLVRALRELQALAIVHVQAPLQREGVTLSSRLAAGLPPVPDPDVDYFLAYDGTSHEYVWVPTTTVCP